MARSRRPLKSRPPLEPIAAAPPRPLWRRVPWGATTVSVLVLLASAFAVEPVRDALSFDSVQEASLALSPGYVALAPLSNVLDTLTLLGVGQHVALVGWLVALYLAWRALRAWLAPGVIDPAVPATRSRARRELVLALGALLALLLVYAMAAVLPRPMAALAIGGTYASDVVAVDFHAHTSYSHDGRRGFGPEQLRAWERGAGFDVAYVADHRTVSGAEHGIAGNPRQAGEGTMLLQALEVVDRGEHLTILSAERTYKGLTTPSLRDLDTAALRLASFIVSREPVLVFTMPGRLDHVHAAAGPGTPGVRAIEVIDGAPRGLAQTRRARARIVARADTLDLAPVAGSDNHGWGRAAAGWTLLNVSGWRGMSSDSLANAIEFQLRRFGRGATRVVERRVGDGTSPITLAFTPFVVGWRMLTTLSPVERGAWLAWTWALWLAALLLARRRRRARLRLAR